MEIRRQYLQKYLHDIAIDQLIDDYASKGYEVEKERLVGNYRADLVAKKGDETVVVEVRTGRMTPQRKAEIAKLSDYIKNQKNYRFMIVLANPPSKKRIDIPNVELLLLNHLIENFPNDLDSLSSRTRITDVSSVVINELIVNEDGNIVANGNGIIGVELRYGPKDDSVDRKDAFPFNFEIILKYNQAQELFLANAETIDIDVSSFYE